MMVLIFGLILSVIGLATISFTNRNEIAALKEVNIARANYLADAGLEWGKVWVSSQCVAQNRFPNELSGHMGLFEIGQVSLGTRGKFTVGIVPVSTGVVSGTYLLITTGTVNSGAFGNNTQKGKSIQIKISRNGEGRFVPAGSLAYPRALHSATLLPNGKVLIATGRILLPPPADPQVQFTRTTELYDPDTNTFTPASDMNTQSEGRPAMLMDNGNVLIFGYKGGAGGTSGDSQGEIYDYKTGMFTLLDVVPTPTNPRDFTLLPNGKVLCSAECDENQIQITSTHFYDPDKQQYTPANPMLSPKMAPTITYIASGINKGKFLFWGGYSMTTNQIELYDPKTDQHTYAGSAPWTMFAHWPHLDVPSVEQLSNGKILFAGGRIMHTYYSSAVLYDPDTMTFSATGSLPEKRGRHNMILMGNGKVLVIGGENGTSGALPPLVYDPDKGTFSATGPMIVPTRRYFTTTRLKNGNILIVGGYSGSNLLASAEVYECGRMIIKIVENSYSEW